jgi:transcriptional regulator with XRE-family HTH domain
MPELTSNLGATLRTRRREQGLSLRDLADATGVSFNTLSRVERGHMPDLRNFQRIVDWLEVPAETFLDTEEPISTTPHAIARHLHADRNLSDQAARKIAAMVEEMYERLANPLPTVSVHLRAAKTFTPKSGELLAEILNEMQGALEAET